MNVINMPVNNKVKFATHDELRTEFNRAMEWFNFERVLIVMNALNWQNFKDEFDNYRIDLMKKFVTHLFDEALSVYNNFNNETPIVINSGGFQISLYTNHEDGPGVSIEFIVSSAESYKDM